MLNKNSNIVKYYCVLTTVFYLNIFKTVIYSCGGKAEISVSLLITHMILQKSS